MARWFVAFAFAVVVVLPLVPPPAAAESVAPGWNVFVATPLVFAGDAVNITVKGIAGNFTVQLVITDPNGTVDRQYFPRYRNTIATYNYTTKFTDATGKWTVTAFIEEAVVATADYEVRWDDLNYAMKRISLLEKQNVQQAAMIKQNSDKIQDLDGKVFWFFVLGIFTFALLWGIGFWCSRVVSWPVYCFLNAIGLEFGRRDDNPWRRLIRWLTTPYPPGVLAAFHEDLRRPKPRWVDEAMARRARQYAAEHGVTYPAEPPKGPVKKKRLRRPSGPGGD